MYIEIDLWVLILFLMVLTLVSVFSFIIGLKENKAYKEAHKPKKDKAQIILNKLNDRIIDLHNTIENYTGNDYTQTFKDRLQAFYYVKGMVEAVIKEEENDSKKR